MIKDNQRRLNQFHVILDGIVIVISYLAAYYLVFSKGLGSGESAYEREIYLAFLYVIVPGYLILYWMMHLYTPKRVQGRRVEVGNVVKANLMGIVLFITCLFLIGKYRLVDFSRSLLFLFCVLNIVLEVGYRNILRIALRSMRSKGYNQKHILLLGYSRTAQRYIDLVSANPEWGYKIRGILDDNTERGTEYKGVRVIGSLSGLEFILPLNRLDEIAITLGIKEYDKLEHIVAACEKSGVHTKFIPDYNNIIPTRPYTEDLMGLPVIHIRYVPLTDSFNAALKRAIDLFGAVVALILFSPIMLLTAAAIRLTSPGPVIFSQERIGRHNKPFKMYKFRSMELQPPEEEKKEWTVQSDPRITGVGRLIRRMSIDELPQLINVLKGDMSLVGPRPERPFFVDQFKEEIPRYMVKHQVRPGMTGWAQINGYRGDTSIRKRIEHDLYYIENWTVGFDFKILFLTFFKGFINRNAY